MNERASCGRRIVKALEYLRVQKSYHRRRGGKGEGGFVEIWRLGLERIPEGETFLDASDAAPEFSGGER